MSRYRRSLVVTLAYLAIAATSAPALAADIAVTVTGVRNANGTIFACLWLSGWGFPDCESRGSKVKLTSLPAATGTVTFTFTDVPDGRYAISVGHDQNGDGVLERHKYLKYPLEGAGISNFVKPPRFIPFHHDALFDVKGPVTEVVIPMHYPE